MSDTVQIIVSGDSSAAIASINKTIAGLKNLETASANTAKVLFMSGGRMGESIVPLDMPERLGQVTRKVNETTTALGMTRREWMRTGSETAYYIGSIVGKTGEMGEAIQKTTGMVTQLGESFMFGGAVGATIALAAMAFGAVVDRINKVEAAANAVKASFADARKEIQSWITLTGVDRVAQSLGVSSTALKEWASSSDSANTSALALTKKTEQLALAEAELKKQIDAQAAARKTIAEFEAKGWNVDQFKQSLTESGEAITTLTNKVKILKGEIADASTGLLTFGRDASREARLEASRFGDTVKGNGTLTDQWNTKMGRLSDQIKDETDSTNKYADALQRVADAQRNILQGLVEKSLTPTSVTDEDMEKSKQGTYTNKWDEFRRRLEAVVKGTNPAQFGADFEAALSKLNMPLDTAIEKFKNFSIFADPKNLKNGLVDWDAFTSDIGEQLLGLVGKANLMKEGFAKAWASLSADQKRSLRELGIESAGDAKKALMGTADSGIAGFVGQVSDKETVKTLKSAGTTIIANVEAGILDKETMKKWLSTMDQLIASAIGQFVTKENVKILTDAGASMLETIAQGLRGSTALTDAMLYAVDSAIKEALTFLQSNYGVSGAPIGPAIPAPVTVPAFASGGMGIFRKGGLVRVDDGEGYMFTGRGGGLPSMSSGTNITINYAPQMSLATRAEATAMLESIVMDVNRRLRSRQA